MLTYAVAPSGQSVSSGFYLERADLPWIVEVPSIASLGGVRFEFSTVGTGGPFVPAMLPFPLMGAGAGQGPQTYVWSEAGPGLSLAYDPVPSPFCRVAVQNSVATVSTFTIHALAN